MLLQAAELQRDPSRAEIESEMQRQKARSKQPVGCSNVSHISAGASHAEMPSPSLAMEVKCFKREYHARMSAMEANVKAIMTFLNVPVPVDTNIGNVQRPSSILHKHSTPNMDSMAPDQSMGENMITSQRLGELQHSTSECLLKSVGVSIYVQRSCIGEFFMFIDATLNLNYVLLPMFCRSQSRKWPSQNQEQIQEKVIPIMTRLLWELHTHLMRKR